MVNKLGLADGDSGMLHDFGRNGWDLRADVAGSSKVLAILVVSLFLGGCFSGEYNRRMEETIDKLNNQVHLHSVPTPVPNASTGVSIRLPELIDSNARTLQVGGEGSDEAQPPFLKIPGFAFAYQFTENGNPSYLYLAAVPIAEKTEDDLANEIVAAVRTSFSSAAWRDTEVSSPEGARLTLKRMSVVGNQKFGGVDMVGRFDLYLDSSASHHVLLGWRGPTQSTELFRAAEASVGSMTGTN